MAKKSKPPAYDLKAADRRRNLSIQIGLTAVVVIFAVALVLYIVTSKDDTSGADGTQAIRVTSNSLIKTDDGQPKAVLKLYEDFLCPACAGFEAEFGQAIDRLINTGAIAADYHMVAILDSPQNQNYSSRAGAAAYCVADENIDAFRRFHAALYQPGVQPDERGSAFPDNARLIEWARQAGAGGGVADCINSGRHLDMVSDMAAAAKVTGTPTITLNDEPFQITQTTTPETLINKVKEIVGNVPGLDAPAQAPPGS